MLSAQSSEGSNFDEAVQVIAQTLSQVVAEQDHHGSQPVLKIAGYRSSGRITPFNEFLAVSVRTQLIKEARGRFGLVSDEYTPLLRRNNNDFSFPDVDYLIAGSVTRSGNLLQVQTDLMDPDNGIIMASLTTSIHLEDRFRNMLISSGVQGEGSVDSWEPDDVNNPSPLYSGEQYTDHTIAPGGDTDWFEYEAEGSGIFTLATGGSMDTVIEAYGPDDPFHQITSNDDYGSTSNARVQIAVEAGKQYFFAVRSYNSDRTGAYSLSSSFETLDDPLEPNNDLQSASSFPLDQGQISSSFFPEGDSDWFSFHVDGEENAQVVIETSSTLDTYLSLYDSNGNQLVNNDDSGENYNARIDTELLPGMDYYVELTDLNDSSGNYSLTITVQ